MTFISKYKNALESWFQPIVRVLYPPYCYFCDVGIESDRYLCDVCFDGLARVKTPYCMSCGEVFEGAIVGGFQCSNCAGEKQAYSFARAGLTCSESSMALVHGLKYQKKRHLARALAPCMAEAMDADPRLGKMERWVLVPVPLHWKREWKRGFNQAHELAQELSKLTGIPVVRGVRRIMDTPTQTRLSRAQRLKNVKGAFTLVGELDYEGVILVDDVFTTGATVNACAAILREIFPRENIVVLTAMRG